MVAGGSHVHLAGWLAARLANGCLGWILWHPLSALAGGGRLGGIGNEGLIADKGQCLDRLLVVDVRLALNTVLLFRALNVFIEFPEHLVLWNPRSP